MLSIADILSWVKKNVSRRDVLIMAALAIVFFVLRLIRLDQFPIFSDEGIYIRWSQVAWKNADMRFISLSDGRQPLHTWGMIPFLKLFDFNHLLAGRLFSVTTGLTAFLGIFALNWYLFNKKAAYFGALLYAVTPYFIFYDRMALIDSAINAATIWMFFLSIVLARTRRIDIALILGFVTGMGMLGKSSLRLYAGMMLFAALIVMYEHKEATIKGLFTNLKDKLMGTNHKINELLSFFVLYGISMTIALGIYNVQRLSSYLHFVEQKNTTFVLTLPELIADPFQYFPTNIVNIPYYIFSEMGVIVAVLGVVGLYFMYKKDRTVALYLLSWLLVALVAISFVAKVLFPRYVLSLGGLLVVPAAYLLSRIENRKNLMGILAVILISISYLNYTIIFDHAKIPFPQIDRGQYLEGWPAGWGVKDIVDFAKEKSLEKKVILVSEGDFGMAGDVLRTHIGSYDQVVVSARWPLTDAYLIENQERLDDHHIYVVYGHCKTENYEEKRQESQMCETFEDTKPLRFIEKYDKPGNKAAIYLFELLPASESQS